MPERVSQVLADRCVDGSCGESLARRVRRIRRQRQRRRGAVELGPPDPPVRHVPAVLGVLDLPDGEVGVLDRRFWRAELDGAPSALPLPTDAPYPARQTFAAGAIDTTIGEDLADALRHLAAEQGVTLFAVLLAAYALVLARLTGTQDLLIAVPMAARTRPETESVVGLFMNTVPIRILLNTEQSLSDLVKAVHTATARALEHQDLQFASVVELVKPDRDPARLPLVQVMFTMEEPWTVPDRGGLRWRPQLIENGTAKFEIELAVTDTSARPLVRVNYNSDLFDPATGQLVADGFTASLRCIADHPDQVVGDADIMSPGDFGLVMSTWPDGGAVAEPDATAVAQLWAACTGDSVVAVGADGELTGDEVRHLAQRVAAALAGHGVGVS